MNDSLLPKILARIIVTVGILGVAAGIGLALAFPIKWTWNATMPYIFGLPVITWGKAWCLSFLSHCLIKSTLSSSKS